MSASVVAHWLRLAEIARSIRSNGKPYFTLCALVPALVNSTGSEHGQPF